MKLLRKQFLQKNIFPHQVCWRYHFIETHPYDQKISIQIHKKYLLKSFVYFQQDFLQI